MSPDTHRILLMLENAGSGSGRHVLDLAAGLLDRGHDVTLLYSRARIEPWFAAALGRIAGLKASETKMVRGISPRDPLTILNARKFVMSAGPFDIVHGHSSKAGAVARLAASGIAPVRIYTPHAFFTLGGTTGSIRARFYAALERYLARHTEGVICVSQAEYEHARELGLPEQKLFMVPNGLGALPNVDRASLRRSLGLDEANVCIGFVGRLAAQKSVDRLIDAFAAVCPRHPEARLAVVGFGPDEQALRAQAERLGIGGQILWLGAANGPETMAAFDVFALSSRYEAFPYVLLEAAARHLPIVSTRVGGVDEMVHDCINGFVAELDDDETLATRLGELIADADLRARMGAASYEIGAHFDVDNMVTKTLAVYDELLSRR